MYWCCKPGQTCLCSRSARTILTKSFFCQSLGYLQRTCLSTCPLVLYIFSSARHEKGPSSMHSKHLLYWSFPFQHLGLRLEWINQVKHASSSKNSLLLFHTLGLQHYTLCFECCCSRFCFGNSRNRSQNFEFWLNAIQNLSFIICGSFIVFQLSCYSILSKDW